MKTKNKKLQLKAIKETEGNPNVMDDGVFAGLVGSMRKKGWYFEPATVWEYEKDKYRAISGHKRIQAAIQAGIIDATFRVICDPEYTEAQARLDLLEANHRQGKDDEELAKRFIESMIDDLDIDIDKIVESTGIDDVEIENILNFMEELEDNEEDNEVPEVKKTNIKLGDIFQLGNHRIMCGDSTKIEDVEKLMGGVKADMVFTDPPYGVSYADKNKFLNSIDKGNRIQTKIIADHDSIENISKLWSSVFQNISKIILKDCSSYYICSTQGGDLYLMMMMMNKNGLPLKHNLIWAKNNHVLGRCDYNYKHEPILYGWNKKHKFYGYGDQKFSIWNYNKPLKNDLHPTMKPVELIVNAILNSSQRNMTVCDPFLGLGSTLIAAEKTNRKCYGMEIDPLYLQTTIDRWENYTDLKADAVKR